MSGEPGAAGKSIRWAALALVVLLIPIPFVSANHSQPLPGGGSITFKDKTSGNDWWVEAIVQSTSPVSKVEVMDDGGPWAAMTNHPEWGSWALGYHVEAGHRVTFRATTSAGTVTSCPFTHPAGIEQCSSLPPPTSWTTTPIGAVSGSVRDLALGDADNDGHRDITIATSTGVEFHEWTGTAWTTAHLGTLTHAEAVAVGDAERSGRSQIFVMSGGDLVRLTFDNGAWAQVTVLTFPEQFAGDMTFGDIDGAPGLEMYIGMTTTTFDVNGLPWSNSTVHQAYFTNGWSDTRVSSFFGRVDSLWVADGDRDGKMELYMGHGTRHAASTSQVRLVSGAWTRTVIGNAGSTYGESMVVAGDGDRDGKGEVYSVSDQGDLRRSVFANGAWSEQSLLFSIPGPSGDLAPRSLFLGDGDADGSQELYLGSAGGDIAQVRWDGAQWRTTVAANRAVSGQDPTTKVLVADADGNGKSEIYATTSGTLWQLAVPGAFVATTGTFDATFTSVRGNEYWIQSSVTATGGTLSKVDVRLNTGPWQTLTKQSWGGWAASYHAIQGTVIQLRATSTAAATDLSDCYRWIPASNTDAAKTTCPGGTPPPPPPPPPPSTFDATFTGVQGNEWWVQVNVAANQPLAAVSARVHCSITWQPLSLQSWGGWAASFQIPAGTKVDFQARSTTQESEAAGGYIWPQATPSTGCPQGDWPRQGSNATYALSGGACGGGNCENAEATMRLTYDSGRWLGVCEGRDLLNSRDGSSSVTPWTSTHVGLPPSWLTPNTQVGAQHRPDMFQASYGSRSCGLGWISSPVFVVRQEDRQTSMKDAAGNPVTLRAWYALSNDAQDNVYTTHWDTKIGLVLEIDSSPRTSSQGSRYMTLTDTNAPLR